MKRFCRKLQNIETIHNLEKLISNIKCNLTHENVILYIKLYFFILYIFVYVTL